MESPPKASSSISSFERKKKGNRAGKTLVAHISTPADTFCMFFAGLRKNKTTDAAQTRIAAIRLYIIINFMFRAADICFKKSAQYFSSFFKEEKGICLIAQKNRSEQSVSSFIRWVISELSSVKEGFNVFNPLQSFFAAKSNSGGEVFLHCSAKFLVTPRTALRMTRLSLDDVYRFVLSALKNASKFFSHAAAEILFSKTFGHALDSVQIFL